MKAMLFTAAALLAAAPAFAQSNPTQAQVQAARAAKPNCDPWITIAYQRLYGDGYAPADWMCSKMLYANGNWGPFSELINAVRSKDYGLYTYRGVVLTGSGPLAGRIALGAFQGGSLVAAGGGNLIAAGAGNLVAAGGGNLVAAGGGNIIMLDDGKLVSPGPRTLMSASSRPVRVLN